MTLTVVTGRPVYRLESTQPPTLSGTDHEYRFTSQISVMLCGWGVKAGMVHSTCG